MKLSARNQFKGTVVAIDEGAVNGIVKIDIGGGNVMSATISMNAIQELQHNTGKHYDQLYIVGGGAKNKYLNRLTEEATGKQVMALPIEATAIGNLRIQMNANP